MEFTKEYMKVERPQAEKRKIHSKNEFELCYLRHQYLRKVDYNPSTEEMAPYTQIISHQAKNTYYTYKNLFKTVGFELDDLVNIVKIHLVSFLGLFKMDKVPIKYDEFIVVFWNKNIRYPSEQEVENKDRANLTIFIKQRMEDLVRICRQKAKNIKGIQVDDYLIYCGPEKPPSNKKLLLEDHEKFNFKKIDLGSFKSIKKKMKIKNNDEPFQFAGYWYVAVPLPKRNLTLLDFSGAGLDPYDNIHNKNPEEILFEKLKEEEFERKKMSFKNASGTQKEKIVTTFIEKNKNNPMFREEVKTAISYLENMRV